MNKRGAPFPKSCIILLLLFTFTSPLLLGALSYFCRDALALNSKAQGEILKPILAKEVLNISMDEFLGKWQVLYLSPDNCDEACLQKTKLLQNLCLALGKDKDRVVLRKHFLGAEQADFDNSSNSLNSCNSSSALTMGSVVIIDPKGWLVTHYHPNTFQAKDQVKGILEDLRRLMRYSYVG